MGRNFIPRGRGVQIFWKISKNFLQKGNVLAQKVKIFLKNGILGGAFYENFEWGILYLKPPLNSRAAKKVWRAALWPYL
jgi:hypothetical protein